MAFGCEMTSFSSNSKAEMLLSTHAAVDGMTPEICKIKNMYESVKLYTVYMYRHKGNT